MSHSPSTRFLEALLHTARLRYATQTNFFFCGTPKNKKNKQNTHTNMQMQWLKGEEKEKHRLSESQCYAKERGKVWCVCKHITEFFVSLQARDAKLTPQYSLISVKMGQLHELLAPPAGKLSFYLPLFWTIKHLSVISGVSLYSVKCTVLCEVGC